MIAGGTVTTGANAAIIQKGSGEVAIANRLRTANRSEGIQRAEGHVSKLVFRQPVGTLILIEGRKTTVGANAIMAKINAENARKDGIRKHLPRLEKAAIEEVKKTLRRTPHGDWDGEFTGMKLVYEKGIIDVVVGRRDCATDAGRVTVDGAAMTPKRFDAYVSEIVKAVLNHVSWTA